MMTMIIIMIIHDYIIIIMMTHIIIVVLLDTQLVRIFVLPIAMTQKESRMLCLICCWYFYQFLVRVHTECLGSNKNSFLPFPTYGITSNKFLRFQYTLRQSYSTKLKF